MRRQATNERKGLLSRLDGEEGADDVANHRHRSRNHELVRRGPRRQGPARVRSLAPTASAPSPSWVSWTPRTARSSVGTRARRQAVTNAAATIYGAKRLIGRKVNADDVSWFARLAPFRIVAAPNGDAWVRVQRPADQPAGGRRARAPPRAPGRRGGARRAGHARGRHRARVLRRRPAPGHARRRSDRRPRRHPHPQRADRGRARLRRAPRRGRAAG